MQAIAVTTRIGCKVACSYCPQSKLIKNYLKRSKITQMSFETFKKCIDKIPRKVKIIFIAIAASFPVVLLIALLLCFVVFPRPDWVNEVSSKSPNVKDYLGLVLLPLILLAVLWAYGKWRMFGFEWHLYEDGLRVFKNSSEIRYIPWENIAKIDHGYIIRDASDGKKFLITLPPPIRRDMLKKNT